MKIFSSIGDKVWQFDQIEYNSKQYLYEKKDQLNYDFKSLGNNRFVFIIDGHSHLVHILKENSIYHIHLDGDYFSVRVEDEQIRELKSLVEQGKQTSSEYKVCAPIPGLITKININEGDNIKPGEGLIILEAMKMENEIKSETEGVVLKILVKEGMPVNKDQELIIIG
jgi:biotin carboxyl carrier protein